MKRYYFRVTWEGGAEVEEIVLAVSRAEAFVSVAHRAHEEYLAEKIELTRWEHI